MVQVFSAVCEGVSPAPELPWLALPGGGAGPDSTPIEKVYFIVEGEMTVTIDNVETVLSKYDSCTIPAGETRKIENRTNNTCTMLVVMPYPPGVK